ncbi:LysR family transcriptional regulator [Actinomyces sp. oral taxon 448 str. F0400]|nr:LysR family transcriptional regulator [Actinomyces sp. oral taxon 448 str. F0400]
MEKRRRRRAEAGRGDQNRADAAGHGAAGVPAEEAHRRWETSGPGGSNRRTG